MCCMVTVTTVTTTPSPNTTPSDPCAPSVVGRKYVSKESALAQEAAASNKEAVVPNKEVSQMAAWALPLLGMVAALAMATFVGARVCRGQRSSRQMNLMQDEELGGAPFVSNDLE